MKKLFMKKLFKGTSERKIEYKTLLIGLVSFAILVSCDSQVSTQSSDDGTSFGHHSVKGNPPSEFTIARQEEWRKTLPFADEKDFEEQTKGFIAAPDYKQIMAEAGHVAWDIGRYEFLLQGEDFNSIHPSLQRQAILNMNYGLYEVNPGIYQVRGFDLSNISFIAGETGWIMNQPKTNKSQFLKTPIFLVIAAAFLLLGLASCSSGSTYVSGSVGYGGYWGGGYYPYYRTRPPGWVGPPRYRPPSSRPGRPANLPSRPR